jgi:hypothetical protein
MAEPAGGIRTAQEPIGALLVGRGVITPEQLESALATQKSTGQPLGKIVVDEGFAAPALVAQALATQHGGLLKTEYGFATGFGSGAPAPLALAEPPVNPVKVAGRNQRPEEEEDHGALVVALPARAPEPPPAPVETEPLRDELAHAAGEAEKLRDDNERLAQLRRELEQRVASESQKAAALERELATARETADAAPPRDPDLEQRIGQLEAAVAARDEAIADFKETAESWKKALVERDDAIRRLVAERDEALGEIDRRCATIGRLEEALEHASTHGADTGEIDELRSQLAGREQALADLERSRDEALKQVTELESARNDALTQLRSAKADLAERESRVPELLAARDAALEELHAANVALEGRDATIAELVSKLESAIAPVMQKWSDSQRHLLFFRGADGYELVERGGPPPEPGDTVNVPGGPKIVARVGASPAPGAKLPCAYLVG